MGSWSIATMVIVQFAPSRHLKAEDFPLLVGFAVAAFGLLICAGRTYRLVLGGGPWVGGWD